MKFNKPSGSTLSLIIFWISIGQILNAQTLLEWEFSDASAVADQYASNVSTSTPSGFMSLGGGVSSTTESGLFAAEGFNTGSLPGALTENDYFSFSVSADPGYSLNLSSIDLYMTREDGSPPNAGPMTFSVFSSIGGFTNGAEIDTFTISGTTYDGFGSPGNIDLSGGSFQDINSVEFRFYGYDGQPQGFVGFGARSGNDLVLNGEVIPEPSTYALIIGSACLGFVIWNRKHKKRGQPNIKKGVNRKK